VSKAVQWILGESSTDIVAVWQGGELLTFLDQDVGRVVVI
jgi:hypothetical protein